MSRNVVYFCMVLLLSVCACQGVHAADDAVDAEVKADDAGCKSVSNGGDWLVFQRRVSSSDFYLGWDSYRVGFGNLSSNFWLGLDNIHYICNKLGTCELCIEMEFEGRNHNARYSTFYLDGAHEKFKLHVDGFTGGNAGDSLTKYQNGRPFSTWDIDNRPASICARLYMGAWWYGEKQPHCHNSNLNGLWGRTEFGVGLNWEATTGLQASVTKSEMKLRLISKS